MNLVKMIEDQLSGDSLNKVSSLLGTDPEATSTAASAAVPTLLSGLANLASNANGAGQLSKVLSGFDTSGIGNFANLLGGDSSSLLNKGSGLLGSLFGDSITASAANAICRFTGLSASTVKSLLALLMPLVLGKVATQWKSQGGTPSALTSLFADQKKNIADAVPTGFSLGDIPGWSGAQDVARAASKTTRRAVETTERAAPSMASWLIPLAVIAVGGLLLWKFLGSRPEAGRMAIDERAATTAEKVTAMKPELPDATTIPSMPKLTDDVTSMFKSVGEVFGGIKDAASAEAAAPKLEELNAKIDAMKKMMGQIPAASRETLQKVVDEQLGPIKTQAEQTLSVPGLSERIKTLINQVLSKLEEWRIIERQG